jgi:ubiquinone/menaquinone biosynthesis C-methylase UbiE
VVSSSGGNRMTSSEPEGSIPENRKRIPDSLQRYASHYDYLVLAYRLIGVREGQYRKDTVDALSARPGDTIVDIACGTGLNFPLLEKELKGEGRIIGVDISAAMLDQARKRIHRAGWRNIELVHADIAQYIFPTEAGGILSTFAISEVAEYDRIIQRGNDVLRPGGRLAILDLKKPEHPPGWKSMPFGASEELLDRRPWESVNRYFRKIIYKEYYFGCLYLSVGETVK